MEQTHELLDENIRVFNQRFPQYALNADSFSPAATPNPDATQKAQAHLENIPKNSPFYFYFIGAGDGATPLLFYERMEKRRVFFILESSPNNLLNAFAYYDFRPAIESGRMLFFVGPDALSDLASFLLPHTDIDVLSAFHIVHCNDSACGEKKSAVEKTLRDVIWKIRAYHKNLAIQFFNSYRAPDIEKVAEKHRNGDPLRIMFIKGLGTVYLQYAVRDLEEAALDLGHSIRTVRDGMGYFFTPAYIASEISDFKPDVVIELGCSLTTYFMEHFDLIGQPHIVWFFDNPPIFVKQNDVPALEAHHRMIVALLPLYVRELRSIGLRRSVTVIPVGVSKNVFAAQTGPDPRFAHDVVFIGNIMNPLIKFADQLDDNTKNVITGLRETVFSQIDSLYTAEETARRYLGAVAPDFLKDEKIVRELMGVATAAFREMHRYSFVRHAATQFDTHVYGSGWDNYPDVGTRHGVINNGPELAALYRTAHITLQVHELTQIHPRVLECLAAGGFILAREIPPDPDEHAGAEAFIPNEEIAVFHDRAEMSFLIDYYLKNPEARAKIAQAGRERVLRDFTWQARLRTLLDSALTPSD